MLAAAALTAGAAATGLLDGGARLQDTLGFMLRGSFVSGRCYTISRAWKGCPLQHDIQQGSSVQVIALPFTAQAFSLPQAPDNTVRGPAAAMPYRL